MKLCNSTRFTALLLGGALSCLSVSASAQSVAAPGPGTAATALPDAPGSQTAQAPQTAAPGAQAASITGTVTDTNDDVVGGATVTAVAPSGDKATATSNGDGLFSLTGLKPGIGYTLRISANGFVTWTSAPIVLAPGQFYILKEAQIAISGGETSVTVTSDTVAIATEQIHVEEQQRVLGIIPNFYVVYDKNPAPLPAKLKFKLAFRTALDPISFIGAGALAGMNQAGDTPNYQQGALGYGERYGAAYGDGFTDLMIGGAILPAVLHQDPRYYYQGTGTKKSRAWHAISSPFICKGDNGKTEFNFSSVGGDLASSALSNLYYPASNRGPSLVFNAFAIDTGERVVSTLIQEFVLRKLTPNAKKQTE